MPYADASQGQSKVPHRKRSSLIWRLFKFVLGSIALISLPVLSLIRTATYLTLEHGWYHWFALLAGAVATTILLFFYSIVISTRFGGRKKFSTGRLKFFAVVVLVSCLYGLLYTSGANFKSESVRSTYTSLHPILRMATAGLIFLDGDAVVTDISRAPEDYARMGLSVNENSLHFKQADGYVHAVDIRTRGRTRVRNVFVASYFRLLGFRSLRHVGTADHLHISLPMRR